MRSSLSVRSARPLPAPALLGALALAVALPACAAEAAPDPEAEVVAEVAGKPITLAELEEELKPQLAKLEREKRKILENGVGEVVDQRLLEAEAAARGTTVGKLLEQEVESKLQPVEDAQAQEFYEKNRQRMRQPIEQMMPRIKEILRSQQRGDLEAAFLDTLRGKYNPRILLEPTRVEIDVAGAPAKGPQNAPITIVEYSDFQCPYCSRVLPTLKQALDTYGDQVRVVFRQFPLNGIHPQAQKAAEASLCAHEQGSFWKLHDAMFENQRQLGVDQLKAKAGELGLNAEQFAACLDGGRYAKQVAEELAEGSRNGVSGTPAMFVNGRFLSGAVPFETLAGLIDDELRRKGITPKKASAG
jgi:protein-disulfide isomerase